MPSGINSVVLVGNLTRDPELRSLPSGTALCQLGLAVNSRVKQGEEWTDRPDFFEVVVWGNQGENAAKYLEKGRPVAIKGRLRQERWQTDDGSNRSRVTITADPQGVQFLGSRDDSGGSGGRGGGGDIPIDSGDLAGGAPPTGDDDIPF